VNALAILSGHRAAAEKHAATRLRDSARALQAPSGSIRLYVQPVFRLACTLHLLRPHSYGPLGSCVWLFIDFGAF